MKTGVPASAAILAGGESVRMGRNKSLISVRGRPLIMTIADTLQPLFGELFIVANNPSEFAFTGLPTVPDRTPGMGPLMGLASALEAATFGTLFVIACDMPEIDADLLARLLAAPACFDCAVPRLGEALYEPLFAVYRKTALPSINAALAEGRRGIHSIFPSVRTCFVETTMPEGIRNLNTPEDIDRYLSESRAAPST